MRVNEKLFPPSFMQGIEVSCGGSGVVKFTMDLHHHSYSIARYFYAPLHTSQVEPCSLSKLMCPIFESQSENIFA